MNNKIKKLTLLLITIIIGILLENTVNAWYVDPNAIYGYPYDSTPYSWGQCTWYVWGRAKQKLDISLPGWNDAGTWADSARNAGYIIDYNPTPDSIAVWPCSNYYVSGYWYGYGHVAYVEEVNGDQMAISEGNWAGQNYSEKWISTTDARGYVSAPQFIHLTSQTEEPVTYTPEDIGTDFTALIVSNYGSNKDSSFVTGAGDTKGSNVEISKEEDVWTTNQLWGFERQEDGSYYIRNMKSGLYLDVDNEETANGTNIKLWSNSNSTAQKWYIFAVEDGYRLIPKHCYDNNLKLCLDIDQGGTAEGTNVHLWEYIGAPVDYGRTQKVYIQKVDGHMPIFANIGENITAVMISNHGSNENASLVSSMGNTPKSNVAITKQNGDFKANQIWRFERQKDGTYVIYNYANNLVLDDADYGVAHRTNIQVEEYNKSSAQKWYIYECEGNGYQNSYKLVPQNCVWQKANIALDVDNGGTAEGTNVHLCNILGNIRDYNETQTIYIQECEPPKYTLGDINEDGKVNSRDAKLALQYYVGKTKLTENQKLAGDVNKDGEINSRDAKLILQYYVGK